MLVDLAGFFDPRSTRDDGTYPQSGNRGSSCRRRTNPVDPRDLATVEENLNHNGCELLGVIENRVVAKDGQMKLHTPLPGP